ncbi:MAG: monovalent cation/H(+) antiporter subunit G [Planctomycetota bacterium]|nr:monovalent cation/H(+) antiporter subunit G [Planctomycetota bacterium]
MITDGFAAILILAGVAFSVLAAIGVMRMPDFYMRLQATTKSATLGVSCLAVAAAVQFGDSAITTKSALVVAFLFLTAPVAAQVIGRAAYAAGVPMWNRTLFDEWHELTGKPTPPGAQASDSPPESR